MEDTNLKVERGMNTDARALRPRRALAGREPEGKKEYSAVLRACAIFSSARVPIPVTASRQTRDTRARCL